MHPNPRGEPQKDAGPDNRGPASFLCPEARLRRVFPLVRRLDMRTPACHADGLVCADMLLRRGFCGNRNPPEFAAIFRVVSPPAWQNGAVRIRPTVQASAGNGGLFLIPAEALETAARLPWLSGSALPSAHARLRPRLSRPDTDAPRQHVHCPVLSAVLYSGIQNRSGAAGC